MKFHKINKSELSTDYQNGMTLQQMSKKYKATPKSILKWLKTLEVPRRGHELQRKTHDLSQLVALYESGLDCPDIAKKYKVCSETIRKELIKGGCQIRPLGSHLNTFKNPTKGKGHTDETKQKLREANKRQFSDPRAREKHAELTAAQIAKGKTGTSHNKLEKRVEIMLKQEDIAFIPQYRTGKYVWDFYIPESNTLVEAHGTFWHGDPRVWGPEQLYPVQKKKIARDRERAEWARANDYKLRIIWELDVI